MPESLPSLLQLSRTAIDMLARMDQQLLRALVFPAARIFVRQAPHYDAVEAYSGAAPSDHRARKGTTVAKPSTSWRKIAR